MKKTIAFLTVLFVFACQNSAVEKPDNLIEKDKMQDILFDISLIEAMKTQNLTGGISRKESNEYIYKKYKIDSVQLTNSNKYYASDVAEYRKMFEKIKGRLEEENTKLGGKKAVESNVQGNQIPSDATAN